MRLKSYRILVKNSDIEAMWDFAHRNDVSFHLIYNKNRAVTSVFEAFMNTETYMMFKLAIPFKEIE